MKDEVRNAFEEVRVALMTRSPFFYFFLNNFSVVYFDKYGRLGCAATDGRKIYLYRDWLESSRERRYAVIKHELGHIMRKHSKRIMKLLKEYGMEYHVLANIAADANINYKLICDESGLSKYLNTWNTYFTNEELEKYSIEELFMKLFKMVDAKRIKCECDVILMYSDIDEDGEILQEGRADELDDDELEEFVDDALKRAIEGAKIAGRGMGKLEREIYDELYRSKISWRDVLMSEIQTWLGKMNIMTWAVCDRRDNTLPGYSIIDRPNVYVAIDTSASISREELTIFVSELQGILELVDSMKVIWWDDGVEGVDDVESISEIPKLKPKGFGGTAFSSVADYIMNELQIEQNDMLVVMTDGEWFDKDDAVNKLQTMRAKKILVTVNKVVDGFDNIIVVDSKDWTVKE